jgi:hypothetical protein
MYWVRIDTEMCTDDIAEESYDLSLRKDLDEDSRLFRLHMLVLYDFVNPPTIVRVILPKNMQM